MLSNHNNGIGELMMRRNLHKVRGIVEELSFHEKNDRIIDIDEGHYLVDDRDLEDEENRRWGISKIPAHSLKEEILLGIHDCRHALSILVPENLGDYYSDDDLWFLRGFARWLDPESHDFRQHELEEIFDPKNVQHEGWVDFPDETSVRVQAGIRRTPHPSEHQIAAGLYRGQDMSEQWRAVRMKADFYGRCILPHVRGLDTGDPYRWAYNRLEIALGYATKLAEKDGPPLFIEDAYTKIAEYACNTAPEDLLKERSYPMDEARQRLLDIVHAQCTAGGIPEATILVCENPGCFTEETIASDEVAAFFTALPDLLENGLVIDRVTQVIRTAIVNGMAAEDALHLGLDLARSIYGGKKKPWWFKEDFDMTEGFAGPDDHDEPNRYMLQWENGDDALAQEVAQHAGFAYWPTVRLIIGSKRELLGIAGIGHARAMQVYTQVARDYGIGNLDRAQKVIKVICENLVSAPEQTRTVFLDRLALHAHEQRPISEIIGRMEGSYVHFALPGIQPLMQGLSEFEIDPLSISGPQLEKIAAKFTEPPQKRISMEAILSNGMQTTRLLSNVLEPVAGLLPAPDNAIAKDQEGPLSRMLGFYEQLKAECGHLDIQVSNVYFSFCATRMPDPFAPPKGMLRFLKRYLEIPDPNYRWTAMEHPGNRATVSRQNQERTVRRYALISHLLDTWVCGLATWEQIHGILEWMTEEPSKEFIEEKKRTMAEEKKQGKAEGKRYRQQQIQEKREEYLAEIAKSLENSMRSRDEETKEKYDRNLKYLVKRRDGAAKDLYPDRDDDNDEAHRPGRSWHKRHQKDLLNREVRQQYYETCQRRIMTVADGIHLLEKLGMLVAAKVAPPETFRKAAWGLLQEWREKITVDVGEKEKHEGEHIESMQSLGYTIGNLRNMGDLAVLSEAAIGEIVQTHKGERGIREVISVLEQAAHAWRKTYDMLEQMLRSVSNHPARNPGGLIARQMEVFKEISAIWRGIPCVSDAPALILRKTFGWMHRYGSVAEVVTSMDSTKMEPGDLGRTNSIVRRAVRSITGLSLYDKHDCAPQMPRIGEFHPPETEVRDIIVSDPSLRLPEMSDMRCLIAAESESWMQEVLKWRRQSVGLLPVGAKIHVLHPIDDQKFNAIQHMLDLGKSGFYLIHANTCLIIPPTPSIEELSMIITFLAKEGVIDLDHPEIQFCYPGRLPPKDVAVLGSSILLSTDRGVRFEEKAFCTTHDNLTGARMMAYDAGAPNVDLPFMRDVKGRTDILGRRSLRDGAMGQRIATLLVDRMFGHLFTHLADPFCEKQYEILKRYGIEGVLDAPWIATCSDEAMDNDKNRKHYHQAVKPCVDAYFDCAERMQAGEAGGIITEMRELDAWLIAQMRPIQETLPMQESYRDACVQVLQL